MVTVTPRAGWTRASRPDGLIRLVDSEVAGVAIHWTGSSVPLGATATLAQSVARLEDERAFHTAPPPKGRGWSDIAYNFAVDQGGRVFDARGIAYRSAANGNAKVNRRYGAVTWLIGVGDTPTPALINAFREWRQRHWLARYPNATAVVGHRDLYATKCPGDLVYQLIKSGRLVGPVVGEDDDMAMTSAERARLVDDIARRTAELITGTSTALHPVLVEDGTGAARLPDGRDIDALPTVVGEIQGEQRRQAEVLARIEAALAALGPR